VNTNGSLIGAHADCGIFRITEVALWLVMHGFTIVCMICLNCWDSWFLLENK